MLQKLLAHIEAGRIDTMVVYKVDRLTRSRADFAKIVEVLYAHEMSFASVTHQFDTATYVGRRKLDMPKLPFKDEVWPKFLRENALKLRGLVE